MPIRTADRDCSVSSFISPANATDRIGVHIDRYGVTVIEVLFAMFVVLFGLVALAALLPLAGRQASDSYSNTHGNAMMQNAKAEMNSVEMLAPSISRPWWYADDEFARSPNNNGDFSFELDAARRWYRSAYNMPEMLAYLKQREVVSTSPTALELELARRNGRAYGFCIDPQFIASESREGWTHPGAYQHARGGTQGVFRRSRMPFFDETTGLAGGNFITTSGTTQVFFPKLLRVSFVGGSTPAHVPPPNVVEPLPLSREVASQLVSSGSDLLAKLDIEDESFGPLRDFVTNNGMGYLASNSSRRISWMATMTPSEQTSPESDPSEYDLSLIIFSNRELSFGAAPLAITGSDKFSASEKLCFATSSSATGVTPVTLDDLPVSFQGGSFEVQLWSDSLTDSTLRVGDYVMLSRRIVRGNNIKPVPPSNIKTVTPSNLKIIHRHRWYRVIGTDRQETWPRTVRLQGPPWDYPEINGVMQPAGGYVKINPALTPVFSIDGQSGVPGLTDGKTPTGSGTVSIVDLVTTCTIVPSVVAVYERTITTQ